MVDRAEGQSLTDPEPARGPGLRLRSSLFELAKTALTVLVLVVTIRSFVAEAYVVHGKSMEPTFHDGERLLIAKFIPRLEELEVGDIVIFTHPDERGKRLIKRVVGLPGDTIEIRDGVVLRNGEPLDETAWFGEAAPPRHPGSFMPACVVEADHYFVLGDNRDVSNDSRALGTIARDSIVGKAFLQFYPRIRTF